MRVSRGFTLIEILLVSAVVVILLLATAAPLTQSFQAYAVVDGTRGELVQQLRLAQARAQARLRSAEFGIELESNRYIRYQGTRYAQRDPTYDEVFPLDIGVTLSFLGFTQGIGPIDLHFSGGSGFPNERGTIAVTHRSGRRAFVTVNTAGLIQEARAGTLTLTPEADATIRKSAQWTPDGSSAQLQVYPWEPGSTRRVLVRFSIAGIPPGAMVHSARMTLRANQTFGVTRTVGAYRVTRPWLELGANWRNTGAQNWTTPGGDFIVGATDTQTIAWSGVFGDTTWSVATDVQMFVNGTASNEGWLLKDTQEDSSQAYWFFGSRESATPPQLEVTYDF